MNYLDLSRNLPQISSVAIALFEALSSGLSLFTVNLLRFIIGLMDLPGPRSNRPGEVSLQ
jgi:hypothetical protein